MKRLLWIALLAACGDDTAGPHPDAPPAGDGSTAAGVRLTVTVRGVPAAGARVIFQDAGSGVVLDTMTAMDGTAFAEMDAGGFVTLVEPRPMLRGGPETLADRLDTFTAVAPGDELHVDVEPRPPTTLVMMTVPDDPPALSYDVSSSCGGGLVMTVDGMVVPTPITLQNCHGTADLVAVGRDPDGAVMRAIYQPNVAVSDGGMVALAGTWSALQPSPVDISNVPAWVATLGVERAIVSPRGTVYSTTQAVDPAAATATFEIPATTGTMAAVRVVAYPLPIAISQQQLLVWGTTLPSTIDFTTLAQYTNQPAYDVATRTVTWIEGPGPAGNVVRIELHAYRDGIPARQWDWQLASARAGAASVTFPKLPTADFDFMPAATDSFGVRDLETANIPGGYPAIRARALRTRLDVVAPGAAGQLSYQQLFVAQE